MLERYGNTGEKGMKNALLLCTQDKWLHAMAGQHGKQRVIRRMGRPRKLRQPCCCQKSSATKRLSPARSDTFRGCLCRATQPMASWSKRSAEERHGYVGCRTPEGTGVQQASRLINTPEGCCGARMSLAAPRVVSRITSSRSSDVGRHCKPAGGGAGGARRWLDRHEASAPPAGLVQGVSGDDCVAYDLPFVTTVEMRAVKRSQPAPQGVWQTNSSQPIVALQSSQGGEMFSCFYTFGHHFHAEIPRQCDNRADNLGIYCRHSCPRQRAIDLQDLQRKTVQIAQGGIASTKVIQA